VNRKDYLEYVNNLSEDKKARLKTRSQLMKVSKQLATALAQFAEIDKLLMQYKKVNKSCPEIGNKYAVLSHTENEILLKLNEVKTCKGAKHEQI